MPQILLYDEKEMHIFDVVGYYPEEPLVDPVDITTIEQVQVKGRFSKIGVIEQK